jgi:hypothetical protein
VEVVGQIVNGAELFKPRCTFHRARSSISHLQFSEALVAALGWRLRAPAFNVSPLINLSNQEDHSSTRGLKSEKTINLRFVSSSGRVVTLDNNRNISLLAYEC